MNQKKIEILERTLQRERKARHQAESILEAKSLELYKISEQLREANQKLEVLLDEKTTKLKGVFENINDAYIVMDLEGNVFEMNDIAKDVLGYDINQEPINVVGLIYEEDYEYAMNSFAQLIAEGKFSNYNARIVSKEGAIKWVNISASIIYENGQPAAAQGILRDVTEERHQKGLLEESQIRLSSLIKNLGIAVLLENEFGEIVVTNQRFCNKFSIDRAPEDLVGELCAEQLKNVNQVFLHPSKETERIQELTKRKRISLSDEVYLKSGTILERNYIPIFIDDQFKGNLWTYKNVTLDKLYRKRLEQEKEKYGSVIANMNLGLLEVDVHDRILTINESFAQISGYTNKELVGRIADEVLITEDGSEPVIIQEESHQTEGSQAYEIEIKNKAGEIRNWLVSSAPNYNINGEKKGSIGIYLDISEIKKKNELIQNQQKQLVAIVDNAPFGIILTQGDQIIKTNYAAQEMFGYSESILNELTIDDISAKGLIKATNKPLNKMRKGLIDNFEINKGYYKKNGELFWAKTNVSAVRDNSGNINHRISIIEDITKKQQEKLVIDTVNNVAKSILGKEDIYDIAWEISSNIADYLKTNDCVIYLVDEENEVLEQIAAYSNKATKDKAIINRISLPFGSGIVGDVAESGIAEIITDTSKDDRYVKDDENRLSEITVPIVIDDKVIGVIDAEHKEKNYFTDKHIETIESIATLVALQLRSAVNIRNLNIAQERNNKLLRRLESSNAELKEYAHIVSHDLKSPLRSISALTTWIKLDNMDKFDETSLEHFNDIDMTLNTMETLISDILEFSSIESQEEGKKEEVDLNEVIDELKTAMFIPKHFSINIIKPLPVVNGDVVKFKQLFQNLLGNAISYNNKDDGFVEIDYKTHPSFYEFSVRDNGIGIEKKHFKKIFNIFQSLKKSKESSGVGLSIVKKIVDLYEGEIWLESELDKGTTFFFTLKK